MLSLLKKLAQLKTPLPRLRGIFLTGLFSSLMLIQLVLYIIVSPQESPTSSQSSEKPPGPPSSRHAAPGGPQDEGGAPQRAGLGGPGQEQEPPSPQGPQRSEVPAQGQESQVSSLCLCLFNLHFTAIPVFPCGAFVAL